MLLKPMRPGSLVTGDAIDQFDGLCVMLTPVLWDASLKKPIDLGCTTFQ